jgi:hypothetical protein
METWLDSRKVQEKHQDRLWRPPGVALTGYRRCIPGAKRPRHEADHLPPSSVRFRMRVAVSPLRPLPSWHT